MTEKYRMYNGRANLAILSSVGRQAVLKEEAAYGKMIGDRGNGTQEWKPDHGGMLDRIKQDHKHNGFIHRSVSAIYHGLKRLGKNILKKKSQYADSNKPSNPNLHVAPLSGHVKYEMTPSEQRAHKSYRSAAEKLHTFQQHRKAAVPNNPANKLATTATHELKKDVNEHETSAHNDSPADYANVVNRASKKANIHANIAAAHSSAHEAVEHLEKDNNEQAARSSRDAIDKHIAASKELDEVHKHTLRKNNLPSTYESIAGQEIRNEKEKARGDKEPQRKAWIEKMAKGLPAADDHLKVLDQHHKVLQKAIKAHKDTFGDDHPTSVDLDTHSEERKDNIKAWKENHEDLRKNISKLQKTLPKEKTVPKTPVVVKEAPTVNTTTVEQKPAKRVRKVKEAPAAEPSAEDTSPPASSNKEDDSKSVTELLKNVHNDIGVGATTIKRRAASKPKKEPNASKSTAPSARNLFL